MAASTIPASSSGGGNGNLVENASTPVFSISFAGTATLFLTPNQAINISAGTYKIYSAFSTTNISNVSQIRIGYGHTKEPQYFVQPLGVTYNLGVDSIYTQTLTATSAVDFIKDSAYSQTSYGLTTSSLPNYVSYYANGYFFIPDQVGGNVRVYYVAAPLVSGSNLSAGGTTPAACYGMIYGNGTYVALHSGVTNSVSTSTSPATNFTTVAIAGMTGQARAGAYSTAAALFVIGDSSGNVFSSPTGGAGTWTSRLSTAVLIGQIYAPPSGTYRFIMGGGLNAYVSTDGISWITRTVTTTNYAVAGVTMWGTYYHALAYNSIATAGQSYYSTDTVTWTAGGFPFNGSSASYFLNSPGVANPMFQYISWGGMTNAYGYYSQTSSPQQVSILNGTSNSSVSYGTCGTDGYYGWVAASSPSGGVTPITGYVTYPTAYTPFKAYFHLDPTTTYSV